MPHKLHCFPNIAIIRSMVVVQRIDIPLDLSFHFFILESFILLVAPR
jgi:hypothetical protein